MNLPRISWQRFLASRWFAYGIIAVMLTVLGGGGWYGNQVYTERETLKKTVVRLNQTVERQAFEVAQAEFALSQEQNRQTATKKTVVETKPDGTKIVTKEETDETTETKTEESGSSSSERTVVERETTESETETEERTREVTESGGAGYSVGLGVTAPLALPPTSFNYQLNGGRRLLGPFWLQGVLELNGTTYAPRRFGLGLEFQF